MINLSNFKLLYESAKLLTLFTIYFSLTSTINAQVNPIKTSKRSVRYNRVEGLHVGSSFTILTQNGGRLRSSAAVGYGLKSKEFTYAANLKYQIPSSLGFAGNVIYLHDLGTNDENIMGWLENTAAVFFAKEDFFDYYLETGIKVNSIYRLTRKHELSSSYKYVEYENIRMKDVWSFTDLFGSDNVFRPNPKVLVGNESSLMIGYTYDSRINQFMISDNVVFSLILEKSGGVFGGDFDFNGIRIIAKKYKRTFGPQMLVIRGFIGMKDNNAGEQFLFDLGGIGTLRGFEHKEFTGYRAGMINIDYLFNRAIFRHLPLKFLPFYPTMSLIAFYDAGWSNLGKKKSPLNDSKSFDIDDINSNIGLGYSFGRDLIRVDVGKRLDGVDGLKYTVRFLMRL